MFPPPLFSVTKIDNFRLSIVSTHPRYYELMRPHTLQINQSASDISFLKNHRPIRFFDGLNTIYNNDVNYGHPFVFNPHVINFNVAPQVQQEVDQQPNGVASALRGKPPCMRWTDEMDEMFFAAVDKYGGPKAVKPRYIMWEMEHTGVSIHQIKNHLQKYRAKLNSNDVGGRNRISKASFEKTLVQDVQESSKTVDEWKIDDDVYIPQLPTEAEMVEDHVPPMIDNDFMEEFLKWK